MTNRIPQYDTNNDGSIDQLDLKTVEDRVWSHLDLVSKANAPFDRSEIDTVTNVSAGANAASVVSNVANGEILVFPSGTFTWDTEVNVPRNNWGVICQDDTEFEVPEGFGVNPSGLEFALRTDNNGQADNVYLENITFTVANDGKAAPGVRMQVSNQAYINGLHYDHDGPRQNDGDTETNACEPRINGVAGGHVRVDDLVSHSNSDIGLYNGSGRTGVFIGPSNDGDVTLVRPQITGHRNNGLYVARSSPSGRVVIQDGLLGNNNVSCVRVGSKIEVYNTTIFVDVDQYVADGGANSNSTHNTRGIWFDNKQDSQPNGGLVQGCSFIFQSVERSTGACVGSQNQWGTVRDCQFLINADTGTFSGALHAENTDIRINAHNCRFDGTASRNVGAGSGTINGSDNYYNPTLSPGIAPVVGDYDYEFDWSLTHPDTPGRPADAGTVTSPTSINFRNQLQTTDDGQGNVTVDVVDNPFRNVINHGVVIANGGSNPAVSTDIPIGAEIDVPFIIVLRARDPLGWSGDYGFSYDWSHEWDETWERMNAHLDVTWTNDPGAGNDLEIQWEARRL